MHRAYWLACAVAAVALAAGSCGGRGTLLPGEQSSTGDGSGASGGTGQGASSTQTTNVVVGSTTAVTNAVVTTIQSSSTGGGTCDGTGDCQQCSECAQSGPCADELQNCFNDQSCQDFIDCFQQCQGTPGCFQQCYGMNPMGGQLFLALLQCVLCDECPADCGQFAPPELCEL